MFYDTYACLCQSVCVCLRVSVQLPANRVGSLNPSKITGCYFYLSSQGKGGILAYCHNKEAPDWLSSMIAPPSQSTTHTNTHTAITTPRLDFFVVSLFCLFVLVFVCTEPTERGFHSHKRASCSPSKSQQHVARLVVGPMSIGWQVGLSDEGATPVLPNKHPNMRSTDSSCSVFNTLLLELHPSLQLAWTTIAQENPQASLNSVSFYHRSM